MKACSSSLLTSFESVAWAVCSGDLGKLLEFFVDLAQHGLRADADLFQHGRNDAFLVFEQRGQQVHRQQLGIAVLGGELVRALDGFLRFDGEFVPTDGHENSIYL